MLMVFALQLMHRKFTTRKLLANSIRAYRPATDPDENQNHLSSQLEIREKW